MFVSPLASLVGLLRRVLRSAWIFVSPLWLDLSLPLRVHLSFLRAPVVVPLERLFPLHFSLWSMKIKPALNSIDQVIKKSTIQSEKNIRRPKSQRKEPRRRYSQVPVAITPDDDGSLHQEPPKSLSGEKIHL